MAATAQPLVLAESVLPVRLESLSFLATHARSFRRLPRGRRSHLSARRRRRSSWGCVCMRRWWWWWWRELIRGQARRTLSPGLPFPSTAASCGRRAPQGGGREVAMRDVRSPHARGRPVLVLEGLSITTTAHRPGMLAFFPNARPLPRFSRVDIPTLAIKMAFSTRGVSSSSHDEQADFLYFQALSR